MPWQFVNQEEEDKKLGITIQFLLQIATQHGEYRELPEMLRMSKSRVAVCSHNSKPLSDDSARGERQFKLKCM